MSIKDKNSLNKISENLREITKSINGLKNDKYDIEKVISDTDLIKQFKICKKTSYNWRKLGLDYYKIGKKIYYSQSKLGLFLNKYASDFYVQSYNNSIIK